jgi:hypothetical protein
MLASEWRRLAKEIGPLLGDAGLGQPFRGALSFPGEKYYEVFVEDISKMLASL